MKRAEFKCQGTQAEVYLYDEIGDSWGEGISAKAFIDDLNALRNIETVDVRIHSPGGDVFDGDAMYNALRRHPAEIHTFVDGVAASAASLVVMAGDRATMAQNSRLMIHEPASLIFGTAPDLRHRAKLLDSIMGSYIKTYYTKIANTKAVGKVTEEQIQEWMVAETWFTGQEALEVGLVDEMTEPLLIAASIIHPQRYRNTPKELVCDGAAVPDVRGAWRLAAARRALMMLG